MTGRIKQHQKYDVHRVGIAADRKDDWVVARSASVCESVPICESASTDAGPHASRGKLSQRRLANKSAGWYSAWVASRGALSSCVGSRVLATRGPGHLLLNGGLQQNTLAERIVGAIHGILAAEIRVNPGAMCNSFQVHTQ